MAKEKIFAFISYIVIAFLAYRNCFGIQIPADDYGAFWMFDTMGAKGMLHYFHLVGPYLFSIPAHFILFKLFGTAPFAWIGLSVLLHGLNAFLVFRISSYVQRSFLETENSWISFFAGLLFLLSPYQTEAVIWQPAALEIMLSASFSLLAAFFLFRYLHSHRNTDLLLLHLSFLLAVFSYESSLFFPAIGILSFVFLRKKSGALSQELFVKKILFPQVGFIAAYFISCKLFYGQWIWHGDTTLSTSPLLYTGTLLKYFAKFFLLYRYLPLENLDASLRNFYSHSALLFPAFIAVAALLSALIYFLRKRKETAFLLFLFLCFLVSLIPVLPLDSSFLKYI